MTISRRMCSPTEIAKSLGDEGVGARDFALGGPLCRWVASLGHRQVLELGRVQQTSKTLPFLGETGAKTRIGPDELQKRQR